MIQAKGAGVAREDGFAQFNYVQGQRAAMEGMGKGMATGKSPMIMAGMNVGGAFQPPPPVGASTPRPGPDSPGGAGAAAILSSQASYIILDGAGAKWSLLGPASRAEGHH